MYYLIYKSLTEPEALTEDQSVAQAARSAGKRVLDCHGLGCMAEARAMALHASEVTGEEFLAVDRDRYHHPRWDIIRTPKVGDKVSYAFNGDYYPCGTVNTVSSSRRRIVTTDGRVFWRRRETAVWLSDGTWSLVPGHINERNPHF